MYGKYDIVIMIYFISNGLVLEAHEQNPFKEAQDGNRKGMENISHYSPGIKSGGNEKNEELANLTIQTFRVKSEKIINFGSFHIQHICNTCKGNTWSSKREFEAMLKNAHDKYTENFGRGIISHSNTFFVLSQQELEKLTNEFIYQAKKNKFNETVKLRSSSPYDFLEYNVFVERDEKRRIKFFNYSVYESTHKVQIIAELFNSRISLNRSHRTYDLRLHSHPTADDYAKLPKATFTISPSSLCPPSILALKTSCLTEYSPSPSKLKRIFEKFPYRKKRRGGKEKDGLGKLKILNETLRAIEEIRNGSFLSTHLKTIEKIKSPTIRMKLGLSLFESQLKELDQERHRAKECLFEDIFQIPLRDVARGIREKHSWALKHFIDITRLDFLNQPMQPKEAVNNNSSNLGKAIGKASALFGFRHDGLDFYDKMSLIDTSIMLMRHHEAKCEELSECDRGNFKSVCLHSTFSLTEEIKEMGRIGNHLITPGELRNFLHVPLPYNSPPSHLLHSLSGGEHGRIDYRLTEYTINPKAVEAFEKNFNLTRDFSSDRATMDELRKRENEKLMDFLRQFLRNFSNQITRVILPTLDFKYEGDECENEEKPSWNHQKNEVLGGKCKNMKTMEFGLRPTFVDFSAKGSYVPEPWAPDFSCEADHNRNLDYICPPSMNKNITGNYRCGGPVYFCRDSLAVEIHLGGVLKRESDKVTLINMGPGTSEVKGSANRPNFFYVGIGKGKWKKFTGGAVNDTFFVTKLNDTKWSVLDGKEGTDTLVISNEESAEIVEINLFQGASNYQTLITSDTDRDSGMKIERIEEIYGRLGFKDIIYPACWTTYVEPRGGAISPNYYDEIKILNMNCLFELTLVLSGNVQVENRGRGNFKYLVLDGAEGDKVEESFLKASRTNFRYRKPQNNIKITLGSSFHNGPEVTTHGVYFEFNSTSIMTPVDFKFDPTRKKRILTFETYESKFEFDFDDILNNERNESSIIQFFMNDGSTLDFELNLIPTFIFNISSEMAPFSSGDSLENVKSIRGAKKNPNVFLIHSRAYEVTGGDENDKFILFDDGFPQIINGGLGENCFEIHSKVEGNIGFDMPKGRLQIKKEVELDTAQFTFGKRAKIIRNISFVNITHVIGRDNESEEVIIDCGTKYVNILGSNLNMADSIIIPNDPSCDYNVSIVISNQYFPIQSIEGEPEKYLITNEAERGKFFYLMDFKPENQEVKIHVKRKSNRRMKSKHRFDVDVNFFEIDSIECEIVNETQKLIIEANGFKKQFSIVHDEDKNGIELRRKRLKRGSIFRPSSWFKKTVEFKDEVILEKVENNFDPNQLIGFMLITQDGFEIAVNSFGGISAIKTEKCDFHSQTPTCSIIDLINDNEEMGNNLGIPIFIRIIEHRTLKKIIIIGGDDVTDILQNDPALESHLVGNFGGKENIFFLIPPSSNDPKNVHIYIQLPNNNLNYLPTAQETINFKMLKSHDSYTQFNILDLSLFYPTLSYVKPLITQAGNDLIIKVPLNCSTTVKTSDCLMQDITINQGAKISFHLKVRLNLAVFNLGFVEGQWNLIPFTEDLSKDVSHQGETSGIVILKKEDWIESGKILIGEIEIEGIEQVFIQENNLLITNTLELPSIFKDESNHGFALVLLDVLKNENETNLNINFEFEEGKFFNLDKFSLLEVEYLSVAQERVENNWDMMSIVLLILCLAILTTLILLVAILIHRHLLLRREKSKSYLGDIDTQEEKVILKEDFLPLEELDTLSGYLDVELNSVSNMLV